MTKTSLATCLICHKSPARRPCRNCSGPHCSAHMTNNRCPGCSGELWTLASNRARRATLAYFVVAIPISMMTCLSLMFGLWMNVGLPLLVLALLSVASLFIFPRVAFQVVRRRLTDRRLPVSSVTLPDSEFYRPQSVTPPTGVRRPTMPKRTKVAIMTHGGHHRQ